MSMIMAMVAVAAAPPSNGLVVAVGCAVMLAAMVVQYAIVASANAGRDRYWVAARCVRQWVMVFGALFTVCVLVLVFIALVPLSAVGCGGGGRR